MTIRRPYAGPPLSPEELNLLQNCYDIAGYPTVFITGPEQINAIANMMTEAVKVETYLDRTHVESMQMFRFTDDEISASRDGFGYENMGVTGISRLLAEMFAGRSQIYGDSIKKKTIDSAHANTHTARAFGVLFSSGNGRKDQVEVGMRYARLHLTAVKLGLSLQPHSQLLQEYAELTGVREPFSKIINSIMPNSELPDARMVSGRTTAQMLFRLGRAKPTPHSSRRELVDFLKS